MQPTEQRIEGYYMSFVGSLPVGTSTNKAIWMDGPNRVVTIDKLLGQKDASKVGTDNVLLVGDNRYDDFVRASLLENILLD